MTVSELYDILGELMDGDLGNTRVYFGFNRSEVKSVEGISQYAPGERFIILLDDREEDE